MTYEVCSNEKGAWISHRVNFDQIHNSMGVVYFAMANSEWDTLLSISATEFTGWKGYLVWEFVLVMFTVAILHMIIRAYTIAVCYINLGALSIVNTDPMLPLSKPQLEWIQLEEHLANLKLLKKSYRTINGWSRITGNIIASKTWRVGYYLVVTAGFFISLTTYTSEPQVLDQVRLAANIIVTVLVNLDVYFCFQAKDLKGWWTDRGLR